MSLREIDSGGGVIDGADKELTDAPNTVVGVKQAVGKILHRMLPYILER